MKTSHSLYLFTGLEQNKKRLEAEACGTTVSNDLSYKWAKKLVFDKVKQNMGMDSCKCIGVGAAPIAMESLEYFLSLDIPLLECYGMSETGGPHTGNRPGRHRLGSIGMFFFVNFFFFCEIDLFFVKFFFCEIIYFLCN